jgi:hypothetical protein
MIAHKTVRISYDNESKSSSLLNSRYFIRHPASYLLSTCKINYGYDWRLIGLPLKMSLIKCSTALGLGDNNKLKKAVFYVRDFGLFGQWAYFYVMIKIPATYLELEKVICPFKSDSEVCIFIKNPHRTTRNNLLII